MREISNANNSSEATTMSNGLLKLQQEEGAATHLLAPSL